VLEFLKGSVWNVLKRISSASVPCVASKVFYQFAFYCTSGVVCTCDVCITILVLVFWSHTAGWLWRPDYFLNLKKFDEKKQNRNPPKFRIYAE
jgi:hypothetical protein